MAATGRYDKTTTSASLVSWMPKVLLSDDILEQLARQEFKDYEALKILIN